MRTGRPPRMIYRASRLPAWQWQSKIHEQPLHVTAVPVKDAHDASPSVIDVPYCHWHLPPSIYLSPGSRASPTTWLRDCWLLWRRRGLFPIQRVRPEEGTEEDESASTQFKQDKAGAAGLETSRAVGGARLFCGSQMLDAEELCGLCFFFVSLLMFLFS